MGKRPEINSSSDDDGGKNEDLIPVSRLSSGSSASEERRLQKERQVIEQAKGPLSSPAPRDRRKRRRNESLGGKAENGRSSLSEQEGEDEDPEKDEGKEGEGEGEEGAEIQDSESEGHSSKRVKNATTNSFDGKEHDKDQPPLPPEAPPEERHDDGWQAIWDEQNQAYYFYNSITGESTWTNPRVPQAGGGSVDDDDSGGGDDGNDAANHATSTSNEYGATTGAGEDESEYLQPTYYQLAHGITDPSQVTAEDIAATYTQSAAFNRFTGKFQKNKSPEMYNDENKSRRQLEFYFDVDAAANSHDGRSLKAERQMKKLTKKELKAFREKKKEKKEQKKRAWLKD